MRNGLILSGVLAAMAASAPARAGIVYSAMGPQVGGFNVCGTFDDSGGCLEDLHIAGGGTLQTIRFAVEFAGFGSGPTRDVDIALLLDNGDGLPGAGDVPLFSQTVPDVNIPAGFEGPPNVVSVDVAAQNIVLPDNATVWGFLQIHNGFNVGMPVNEITVGSSDDLVRTTLGSPTPYPQGSSLAWELVVVPEPGCLSLLVVGGAALVRRRNRR